jgi:hypothetical protein
MSAQQQPGERLAAHTVARPSTDVGDRRLRFMTRFVRVAGLYNASAVLILLTPGALELVGVRQPYSPFWVWLPALTGLFAGIVLLLSSMDLRTYGTFPYWNGIVRLVFVVATFSLNFGSDATFFGLLALGDVPLALGAILGLPRAVGRTHWQLVTNRRPP